MKKLVFVLTLGVMIFIMTACGRREAPDDREEKKTDSQSVPESEMTKEPLPFYGIYRITDYKCCEEATLSEKSAGTYIGRIVTYGEDFFQYYNSDFLEGFFAGSFTYAFQDVVREDVETNYHVDLSDWWEKKEQQVREGTFLYSYKNPAFWGTDFFVIDDNTLWIYRDGVFFLAERLLLSDINVISKQSFEVELPGWGRVQFVSAYPEKNSDPFEDISFYLVKDGVPVYQFPYAPNKNVSSIGAFSEISYILFFDYDEDGKKDVVIGVGYLSGTGAQGTVSRTRVRIYENQGRQFIYSSALSNAINERLLVQEWLYLPDVGEIFLD